MRKNYTKTIEQVGDILDLWLPLKIGYANLPGMSVAITYKGKLVYVRGFGLADIEEGKKMTPRTLTRIASISKAFTATAIMQLVEKGAIRLDDPVANYIPWLKKTAGKITIEDLLSHSSGVFRDGNSNCWTDGMFPKDLESVFSKDSLRLKRGTSFKYSNYGFSLLGLVVEKASGMKYKDYIQYHILNPLGMKSTYVEYDENLPHARGYGRLMPGQALKATNHFKTNAFAPATGFSSSAEDLSKFAASFVQGAVPRVLKEGSKRKMIEREWDTGTPYRYGLGLDIIPIGKKKVIGHSGGFLGFSSQMLVDPKEEITVVVLANGTHSIVGPIAGGIFEMLHTGVTAQKKGKALDAKPYVGVYRDYWRDVVCAPLGSMLIGFSATADMPVKMAYKFLPQKQKGSFVIECANRFDNPGEIVRFTDIKGGKAHTAFVGGHKYSRI